jgi:hypothetical protein
VYKYLPSVIISSGSVEAGGGVVSGVVDAVVDGEVDGEVVGVSLPFPEHAASDSTITAAKIMLMSFFILDFLLKIIVY